MAIISKGTTITKVMSGGTPIKKVMSGGTVIWTSTVMRTITIPSIKGIANQKLIVNGETIYNGMGYQYETRQVPHGSIVTIQATPATGFKTPTVTSPVTANANFSTASYITAGMRYWTYNFELALNLNWQAFYTGLGGIVINKYTEIDAQLGTEDSNHNGYDGNMQHGTVSTVSDIFAVNMLGAGVGPNRQVAADVAIQQDNSLYAKIPDSLSIGGQVVAAYIEGEIRQ